MGVPCQQEERILRNEGILDKLTETLFHIQSDLRAIKWCAIGCGAGYVLHQVGLFEAIKLLIGA